MPIDFAAIAAGFRPRFTAQLKSMTLLFTRIGKFVKPRLSQLEAIERATRRFPVLRFYNDAVTAVVAASQFGALRPVEPDPGVLGGVGRGARSFWEGLTGLPRQMVRDELALLRAVSAIERLLRELAGSVERYRIPTPEMFDPRRPRRFTDLFGQAFLVARTVVTSPQDIAAVVHHGRAVWDAWRETFGRPAPGGTQTPADSRPLYRQLDDLAPLLAAALLAIPLAGVLLRGWIDAFVVRAKLNVLEALEGVVARIFALRARAIDFVARDLFNFVSLAIVSASALKNMVDAAVTFYLQFGLRFVQRTVDELRRFLTDFSTWMNQLMLMLRGWLAGMDAIFDTEIIDLFFVLGMPARLGTVLKKIPTLTLRDLIFGDAESIGDTIRSAIKAARRALWLSPLAKGIIEWKFGDRIDALQDIIRIITRNRLRREVAAELTSRRVAFRTPRVDFPNLHDAFFGPGAPPIAATLAGARARFERSVGGVFGAGERLFGGIADAAAAEAQRSAVIDPSRYQALADTADRVAATLFGSQIGPPVEQGPLARAFEQTLARGGFEVIGRVIPAYIAGLTQYWQQEAAATVEVRRETATSPHILARRARLGRVEAPELVIRLPGRSLDDSLVERTAAAFADAIGAMHRSGQERRQAPAAP